MDRLVDWAPVDRLALRELLHALFPVWTQELALFFLFSFTLFDFVQLFLFLLLILHQCFHFILIGITIFFPLLNFFAVFNIYALVITQLIIDYLVHFKVFQLEQYNIGRFLTGLIFLYLFIIIDLSAIIFILDALAIIALDSVGMGATVF